MLKKRTNKWLVEQLVKDPCIISKWCTNTSQPSLETLLKIVELFEVNYIDDLHKMRQERTMINEAVCGYATTPF